MVLVVGSTEGLQQLQVVPWLDLVVLSSWTVDQLLDGVTVVVQDEQVWLQVPSNDGGDLLDSQLQGTVTDEEDDSLLWIDLLSSEGSTEDGTTGETNGTP